MMFGKRGRDCALLLLPVTLILLLMALMGAACAPHTFEQGEAGAVLGEQGSEGATLKKSEDGLKQSESELKKNEAEAAVVYVALGDSTGVGVGAREGGYVARLFERMKREHAGARLLNLCMSGAETSDVLRAQLERAANARATIITLGIGINDLTHGVTPERFAANYDEIVKRLSTQTSARIVLTNLPDISTAPAMPAYFREDSRRRLSLFNERITETATRYGLTLVDTYTVTHELLPAHPEFFSADGFHPSDIGYELWAKTMWPGVKSEMEKAK